ncbi:MAG: trimethylamine methyltransferase family protein [Armatimonadota bacterium]|jgi:trimethylamine--corrinoid protein Co-methyltransferase
MKLRSEAPQVLTDDECRRIVDAAARIAARVPLRVTGASAGGGEETPTDRLLAMLRQFGCEISDDRARVSFPAEVIDRVMAAIARRRASLPEEPAEPADTLTYAASGQALWCCDAEGDRIRAATVEDQAALSRVVDAIPGLERTHPTFIPQDVPAATAEVHAFATIILNSSRPWRVSVYTAELLPHFIELDTLARGGDREAVNDAPTFAAKAWWNTPFMLTGGNIAIGMKARELMGLPLTISTMPVAGAATPVTLAGCLALSTAEVLQCNAISLAVDERLMGWTAGPLTIDPRSGIHTQSGPAVQLIGLAARTVSAHLFGGRVTASGGPTTGAKVPGAQSMMEKTMQTAWAVQGGVRSFGSLATLATADVGSVVQLMLDVEMMRHFERLLEGIRVDEETIAEELICEIAPRGAYFLNEEHTGRHFREELFLPELIDSRVPMAWIDDPVTMLDNARRKALRLIEAAENRCPLSDEQRAQVREIVRDAERVAREVGLEGSRRM